MCRLKLKPMLKSKNVRPWEISTLEGKHAIKSTTVIKYNCSKMLSIGFCSDINRVSCRRKLSSNVFENWAAVLWEEKGVPADRKDKELSEWLRMSDSINDW